MGKSIIKVIASTILGVVIMGVIFLTFALVPWLLMIPVLLVTAWILGDTILN